MEQVTHNIITDERIKNAFISAYSNDNLRSAKLLLELYQDVITADMLNTAFINVCNHANIPFAKWLLGIKHDVITNETINNVFIKACNTLKLTIVELLLEKNSDLIKIIDDITIKNIFIQSCENNLISIAKLLVQMFPDIFYISVVNDMIEYNVLQILPLESNILTMKTTLINPICAMCAETTGEIKSNCKCLFCYDCLTEWYQYSKYTVCPYCCIKLRTFNRVVIETD